jgi:magnesium chelatase family protein
VAVARVACRAQVGLEAPLVQVEVSLGSGLPAFFIVGLPATVVKESKERVRSALLNSRFEFPAGRITVSLAPAELPKEGGRFDLPIALGILLASAQLRPRERAASAAGALEFYGELGLAGELKPVRGLLLAAAHAQAQGHTLIVPRDNAAEASVVAPTRVRAAGHLLEVCAHLTGSTPLAACGPPSRSAAATHDAGFTAQGAADLADVRGQLHAKGALAIAAAGAHSLLFVGPPGAGKSMLAQRLPGLLPPLSEAEALEVAAIAAVSTGGFVPRRFGERPFRAPHHTASAAALVGGGALARPGEISLAHHGVLFLDELPEFSRGVLEALREPLDTGRVAVTRAALQTQYPAAFQLIAAMNPCPCGRLGDPSGSCRCTSAQVRRYQQRLSGPLLDRIHIQVEVPRLKPGDFERCEAAETSATVAARIARARREQLARQGTCNARLSDTDVQRWCAPDPPGRRLLDSAMQRLGFSGRVRQRVLKVARTIADLEGAPQISVPHIAQALGLRCPERRG